MIELWTEMLDNGSPVDAIYLDFRKAFDFVSHERLLEKPKAHGKYGTTRNLIGRRAMMIGENQWDNVLLYNNDQQTIETCTPPPLKRKHTHIPCK